MGKNKLKLNTKYLKTGGYSIAVSVLAIAIVIIVNLFVNQLPASVTQIDMSSTDLLSISDETVERMGRLTEDVTIYYIAQQGSEDVRITGILDRYKELSDKIKIELIDPALNPAFFTGDRKDVAEGSLIVETSKRTKIISNLSIYFPEYTEDYLLSYYYYYGSYPESTSFDAEHCITSAVNYTTTEDIPVVYWLSGHSESLPSTYSSYLEDNSMEVKELNLTTMETMPDDCDVLLISAPQKDIAEGEATKITDYLKKGGKLVFISNFDYLKNQPNLKSVMEYYGLKALDGFVCEGDTSAIPSGQQPVLIIPSYGEHEIVSGLEGYDSILALAHGITTTESVRDTVSLTPIFTTSDKSYSKILENFDTNQLSKADGDAVGPFTLAYAVSEENSDGSETQIIWYSALIDESVDYYFNNVNYEVFLNSFAWMCEIQDDIYIPSKTLESYYLSLTEATGNILTTVFAVIIPLSVTAFGFAVWFRRRRK